MTDLYDRDFFAWTQAQADALKRRSANEIDWDNLRDEVESLGVSTENELFSRLIQLVGHLLKWRYQPTRRGSSWVLTIREQRRRIERVLRKNPSLRARLAEVFEEAYPSAVNLAAQETALPFATFPDTPPFDLEHVLVEEIHWPDL